MAQSFVQYVGTGVLTSFAVPFPYISKEHVKVYVDGVNKTFTWLSASSVSLSPAPALNANITIQRETPKDAPIIDFNDGSTLVEGDLDVAAVQPLYVSQEAFDRSGSLFAKAYVVDELDPLFNGTQKTFELRYKAVNLGPTITNGIWLVSVNGLLQDPVTAYAITKAGYITFAEAPRAGDNATVQYLKFYEGGNNGGGANAGGSTPPGGGSGGNSGGTPPPDGTEYPPIVVGGEPPENPQEGQVWFDTVSGKIKIFLNGVWEEYEWRPVIDSTNVVVSDAAPSSPVEGMVWFDTINGIIKIYTNGVWAEYEWKPLVPAANVFVTPTLPTNPVEGMVVFNTADNQIYFYHNGTWSAYAWGMNGVAEILKVVNPVNLPNNATVGDIAYVTSEDKLYVYATTGWTNNIASANLGPGSISSSMLAANSVVADKIAANSVTGSKIVGNTITGDKIAAATIAAANLQAGSITTDKLAAGAITADKIGANTITGDKIVAFTIAGDKLAVNSITADKLQANSITGAKIAASTITGDKLAVSSISADRIQTNTLILGTQNIAAAAISQVSWVKGGFVGIGGTSLSYQSIINTNMVCTPGATRIVHVCYSHADDYNGSANTPSLFGSIAQLYIGGSMVTQQDATNWGGGTCCNAFTYVDTTSRSGSTNFELRVAGPGSGPSKAGTTVRYPIIVIEELKR